jgi:hypothetical protein
MVPINQVVQDFDDNDGGPLNMYLYTKNTSNVCKEVYVSDFKIMNNRTKKEMDIKKYLPEMNISIARLLPSNELHIKKCKIVTGYSHDDAAKFTLLNNVSYYPMDVEPYDPFTEKGEKSSVSNPTKFFISYKTKGNIDPHYVMILCCDSLMTRLNDFLIIVDTYAKFMATTDKICYTADKFEVTRLNDSYVYKKQGDYLTLGHLIAQKCFILDPHVLNCCATVERLDTEIMIIKIKHPTPDKLLIDGIKSCINDLTKLRSYFEK